FVVSLFFFSSRRRHTRFSRDWSSDVCSSDLFSWYAEQFLLECMTLAGYEELDADLRESIEEFLLEEYRIRKEREYLADFHGKPRSEERRVGKECRSRWARDALKNRRGRGDMR